MRKRWNRCFTAGGYPKRRYETRAQAKQVMRRLAVTEPGTLEVYRCEFCSYFHVGHAHQETHDAPTNESPGPDVASHLLARR